MSVSWEESDSLACEGKGKGGSGGESAGVAGGSLVVMYAGAGAAGSRCASFCLVCGIHLSSLLGFRVVSALGRSTLL